MLIIDQHASDNNRYRENDLRKPKNERVSKFREDLLMRMTIRISYRHLRRARRLGKGNASDGVRYALETAEEPKEENES